MDKKPFHNSITHQTDNLLRTICDIVNKVNEQEYQYKEIKIFLDRDLEEYTIEGKDWKIIRSIWKKPKISGIPRDYSLEKFFEEKIIPIIEGNNDK